MHWIVWLLLAASFYGAWHWFSREREVPQPPGVLVAGDPLQVDLDSPRRFEHKGFRLAARARYEITARVLRKQIYRIDGGADLAPVDLGVGWGPMSDTAIINRLELSQLGRFFHWAPRDAAFPLSRQTIAKHAAQMHMVPATDDIERRLKMLRPGQIIRIDGWLVDIRGPGGFAWNTSLRRDDAGSGACEIVFVEALEVR
jgi:hypothetical protein